MPLQTKQDVTARTGIPERTVVSVRQVISVQAREHAGFLQMLQPVTAIPDMAVQTAQVVQADIKILTVTVYAMKIVTQVADNLKAFLIRQAMEPALSMEQKGFVSANRAGKIP